MLVHLPWPWAAGTVYLKAQGHTRREEAPLLQGRGEIRDRSHLLVGKEGHRRRGTGNSPVPRALSQSHP